MDIYEVAQTIPMKKKGYFGRPKKNGHKRKVAKGLKDYGTRRAAIKRGLLGVKARFGSIGCSSYF